MKMALKAFLNDLLSTIFFLGLFALTRNALLATSVAIAAGVLQIAFEKWRGRPIEAMQWLSMVLVIVFGSAALLTHDNRFIMAKPTLINFAIGAVMLKRGWLDRYLPEIVHAMVPKGVIIGSGYAWSGLMFVLGVVNFAVALALGFKTWAIFTSIVPLAAQLTGFGLQYLTFRAIIVRKFRKSPDAYATYLAAK